MTIANTTVLIASVMPVLTMGLAKASMAGKKRSEGGYDNSNPRGFAASQEGWRARAVAAQNNSFEALPLFVFAVLAAQMAGIGHGIYWRSDCLHWFVPRQCCCLADLGLDPWTGPDDRYFLANAFSVFLS
jgi:uncharacterized MAPEG superfamily protein